MPQPFDDAAVGSIEDKSIEELLILVSDEDQGCKPEAVDRLLRMGLEANYDVFERAVRNDSNADLRNGAMEILVEFGREALPRLVELLRDENEEVRNFSAVMLGDIGSRDVVPQLIQALRDPDVNVSHGAAEALGKIGDRSALGPLASLLKGDFWLQYPAIVAIAEMRDNRAIPLLLELLNDPLLIKPVVEALGKIGDVRALKTIGALLPEAGNDLAGPLASAVVSICRLSDEECRYRSRISDSIERPGIGEVVSPEGAERLKRLLEENPEEQGAAAAVLILGWLGDVSALPLFSRLLERSENIETVQQAIMPMEGKAVPYLLREISSTCANVRVVALRLLRWLNASVETELLLELAADSCEEVRAEALESLRGSMASVVLPLLEERLLEASLRIRTEALNVLSFFPAEAIRSFLVTATGSPEPERRRLLPQLVALAPSSLASADLSPFFTDSDAGVRREAIRAAGAVGSPDLVPYVVARLDDEDPKVREAAVTILGDFRTAAPLPVLLDFLGKRESPFDYALVKALGKIGSPEAGAALAEYLDRPGHTRAMEYAILESLAQTGAPGHPAAATVRRYFSHADPDIRRLSVVAFAAMSAEGAVAELEQATHDEHWSVRIAALDALAKISPEEALPPLTEALADPDLLVRKNAIAILGSIRSIRSVGDLVQQLTDPEIGRVAFDALLSIGRTGLPILHRFMKGSYQTDTRERVIDLIGKISDRRSIDPLLDVLSDPNPAIRLAAIDSLVFCFDSLPLRKLIGLKEGDADEEVRKKAGLALKILTMEKFL
jgi:HEAT repeat protein